jgi:hypothetical protein
MDKITRENRPYLIEVSVAREGIGADSGIRTGSSDPPRHGLPGGATEKSRRPLLHYFTTLSLTPWAASLRLAP